MKHAMILAAGRGERLKPITDKIPKALCEVNGSSLLERHIVNLAKAGFDKAIINHAYLGDKIRHFLGRRKDWGIEIVFSPEPPGGLETGGGIFQALPLLGKEAFIVVNADIYTDYPFNNLHLDENMLAKIILAPNPPHNKKGDFGLIKNRFLSNDERLYTFTGISCLHPKMFSNNYPGRYSLTPGIRQLIPVQQITAEVHNGLWIDIGSKERLLEASEKAVSL